MSDVDTARPTLDAMGSASVMNGSSVEVADGVFVIPDGRVPLVPNIGVIVGDRTAQMSYAASSMTCELPVLARKRRYMKKRIHPWR